MSSNTLKFIGDELTVTSKQGLCGVISITGYVDNLLGITATRFVDVYVRWSGDGVIFSEWERRSVPVLQSWSIGPEDVVFIETKYVRQGTDTSGEIAFVDLQYSIVTVALTPSQHNSYLDYHFVYGCCDPLVYGWLRSVLNQVYLPGFVPQYIERNSTYVQLWRSLICIPALIVAYARLLTQTTTKGFWATKLLRSFNIFTRNDQQSVNVRPTFATLIRNRGTHNSLRNEFAWLLADENRFYSTLVLNENESGFTANQLIDWTVEDINLFTLPRTVGVTVSNNQVTLLPGSVLGVVSPLDSTDLQSMAIVDHSRSYVVRIVIRQTVLDPALTVSVIATSDDNTVINLPNSTIIDGELFSKINVDYCVRFVIIGSSDPTQFSSSLDVGFGNHVHLTSNVAKISIVVSNTGTTTSLIVRELNVSLLQSLEGGYCNTLGHVRVAGSSERDYSLYRNNLPYNTNLIVNESY